jgi:hypothetical protein
MLICRHKYIHICIHIGDTIVAIIDTEIPKTVIEIPKTVEAPVRVESSMTPEVIALIAKQQVFFVYMLFLMYKFHCIFMYNVISIYMCM